MKTNREIAIEEINMEIKECVDFINKNPACSIFNRKALEDLLDEKEMLEDGAFVYYTRRFWLPVAFITLAVGITIGLTW